MARELNEVAPGVLVGVSRNYSTTTTVLASGSEALVIDAAWMPDELEGLGEELAGRGLAVVGGFSTHAHHDHLLWHPSLGDAPRWAAPNTARIAQEERETLVSFLGPDFPPDLVELMGRVRAVDGEIPETSVPAGFAPEIVAHDGHAPGHAGLWLANRRVLVAGDMLSDVELPLPFYPDDLPAYLVALDLLAPKVAEAEVVIPGHGSPGTDAQARLDADRRYLDDVIADRIPDDPRLGNPGMREEYEHLKQIVERSR